MTTTTLQQRLEDAVEKLAVLATTDAVGHHLMARGIKATRRCPNHCVLAEYLAAEVGIVIDETGFLSVNSNDHETSWSVFAGEWRSTQVAEVRLPCHVGQLAREFDRGCWPALEAQPLAGLVGFEAGI